MLKTIVLDKLDHLSSVDHFSRIVRLTLICVLLRMKFYFSYCPVTHEVKSFNVVASETRNLFSVDKNLCSILKAELAVPVGLSSNATRSHCALHILGNHPVSSLCL